MGLMMPPCGVSLYVFLYFQFSILPSVQKFTDEPYEPPVRYAFFEYANQYVMVYVVEEAFYVPLYKPFCSEKRILNLG